MPGPSPLIILPFLALPALAAMSLSSITTSYGLTAASYNFSFPTTTLGSSDADNWVTKAWDLNSHIAFGQNDMWVSSSIPSVPHFLSVFPLFFLYRRIGSRKSQSVLARSIHFLLDPSQTSVLIYCYLLRNCSSIDISGWTASRAPYRIPTRIVLESDGWYAVLL